MRPAIPILETPRLRLRPLRLSDAPQSQRLFPHWEILQFMSAAIPWPYPDDGARQHIESVLPKIAAGQEYDWAITLKSANDDLLIGIISLYPDGEDNRGFWLGRAYQNQGLMKEAMSAVNDFAFGELEMPHLTLNNAEPNKASHRLKEISGAKIVEINDGVPYVGGRFRQIRWRLTREDWENHRHSL
jgi:ribosomal-protein-alanine N-acetyltransferase